MQIPHTIWNPGCNSVCCLLVVSSFFRLSLVIDKTIFVQTFTCLCLLNKQLWLWNLVLLLLCLWNYMLLSTEILEFPTSFFHVDLINRTHFTANDFNPKTSISFVWAKSFLATLGYVLMILSAFVSIISLTFASI